MIHSIGNGHTTIGAPPSASGIRAAATPFAEMFGSLTATDATGAPSSFTTRRASAGDGGSTAEETAEAGTLAEALAAFKKELSMTPAERVRRDVLKSMALTEEAIEALPHKERVATEDRIAREVARRMEVMNGGQAPETAVATGQIALS